MTLLQRIIDRLRHPGEYSQQSARRRYLQGIDHALIDSRRVGLDLTKPEQRVERGTYVLSTVREVRVGDPWWTEVNRREAREARGAAIVSPLPGPIVGVTFELVADSIGTGNAIEEALPGPCPACGRNPALEGAPVGDNCHERWQYEDPTQTAELYDEWSREPTCDICDEGQFHGADGYHEGPDDWNGETGNHLSCEAEEAKKEIAERVAGLDW